MHAAPLKRRVRSLLLIGLLGAMGLLACAALSLIEHGAPALATPRSGSIFSGAVTFELPAADGPPAAAGSTREIVTIYHLYGGGLLLVRRKVKVAPPVPTKAVPRPAVPRAEFLEEITLDARDELLPNAAIEFAASKEEPVWISGDGKKRRKHPAVAPEDKQPNS